MLVVSLLGAGWIWLRAEAALRAQLDLTLAAEAEGFVRAFEAGGVSELVAAVNGSAQRLGPLGVLLQSPEGYRIAGRIGEAPAALRGFATVAAADGRGRRRLLGATLPGGLNLIVGAALGPIDAAARGLAYSLPAAGGLAASVAFLLAFGATRRAERRLAQATGAARTIMDGELGQRLPVSGDADAFDRLSGTMNALLARIQALVEAQRKVTDDIAHDLRSPLSRLRQLLERGMARPGISDAEARIFEQAIAELDSILATFAALLRIARIESGALRAGFRPVDLAGLAMAATEMFAPLADEDGKRIVAEVEAGPPIAGDGTVLRQALANLLENALTHGGGTITVRVRRGRVLEVEDDGPGIPPDERGNVLRRFHRLDASRSLPGSGLGLALVAAAAAGHGARLSLNDAVRQSGLCVRLDFTQDDGTQDDGPARARV